MNKKLILITVVTTITIIAILFPIYYINNVYKLKRELTHNQLLLESKKLEILGEEANKEKVIEEKREARRTLDGITGSIKRQSGLLEKVSWYDYLIKNFSTELIQYYFYNDYFRLEKLFEIQEYEDYKRNGLEGFFKNSTSKRIIVYPEMKTLTMFYRTSKENNVEVYFRIKIANELNKVIERIQRQLFKEYYYKYNPSTLKEPKIKYLEYTDLDDDVIAILDNMLLYDNWANERGFLTEFIKNVARSIDSKYITEYRKIKRLNHF